MSAPHSETLRREVHEVLNAIDQWNRANGFILYGKGVEIATNRLEDQEVSMRCLHLLQIALVHVKTLMIQRVLSEPAWMRKVTEDDLRALTPLNLRPREPLRPVRARHGDALAPG